MGQGQEDGSKEEDKETSEEPHFLFYGGVQEEWEWKKWCRLNLISAQCSECQSEEIQVKTFYKAQSRRIRVASLAVLAVLCLLSKANFIKN